MAADTIVDTFGEPAVPVKAQSNDDGTYSLMVALSPATITALAAAIANAVKP